MIEWWWILVAATVGFAAGYVLNGAMTDGSDEDDQHEAFMAGAEYARMHPKFMAGGKV